MVSVFQPMCGTLRPPSGSMPDDGAGDPAEAPGDGLLAAFGGHQLHADADAEERHAAPDDALFQHLDHAGDRIEAGAAIGEGADAGQHDAVGAADDLDVVGDDDLVLGAEPRGRRVRRPWRPSADCPSRNR